MLAIPEIKLDESECSQLARAVEKVARHYDLPDFSKEMVDWVNLISVLGMIYGTRFVAAGKRAKAAKNKATADEYHDMTAYGAYQQAP